jgi:hypothetical protein
VKTKKPHGENLSIVTVQDFLKLETISIQQPTTVGQAIAKIAVLMISVTHAIANCREFLLLW